jgi:hypothetical protein
MAPMAVLLALKESHIYQPVNWQKHIADLHCLRAALPQSEWPAQQPALADFVRVRVGVLLCCCSLLRWCAVSRVSSFVLNLFAFSAPMRIQRRRAETDARLGVPAEHINLRQSNDAFLAGSTGALSWPCPLFFRLYCAQPL